MDPFVSSMVRVVLIVTMVAAWLATLGVIAVVRRMRMPPTTPTRVEADAPRGPAANAEFASMTLKEAA